MRITTFILANNSLCIQMPFVNQDLDAKDGFTVISMVRGVAIVLVSQHHEELRKW